MLTIPRKRIAVIGSGVAGLGAAYALKDVHDVTLIEADERLGGHANTVDLPLPTGPTPVDTGFIVFNGRNYPNFVPFLEALGVAHRSTDMSFGFAAPNGLEWCSYPPYLAAQLRNFARKDFRTLVGEWVRFNKTAKADLSAGRIQDQSLQHYLDQYRFAPAFREAYLLPMAAAIWSTSETGAANQAALPFLRFFNNHGLLDVIQPRWRTVSGGSRTYVQAVADLLGEARIQRGRPIAKLTRDPAGVTIQDAQGRQDRFDEVILACHSDQALRLLADADGEERQFLGAIRYAPNEAVVHADAALMPARRTAWAAWNYRTYPGQDAATITYYMNRLQHLPKDSPVFITLNPSQEPDPAKVYARIDYAHPQFDEVGFAAQRHFNRIQGVRRTWFAGAWLGYGFHEDGLRAGLRVALKLGGRIPWAFVEGDVDGGAFGERADIAPARLAAAQ